MKKLDLLTVTVNALLAFLIGLAGIGCFVTAFSLDVSPGNILLACAFWAVCSTLALQFKLGRLVVLGAAVLWGIYFWKKDIVDDFLALLDILFSLYDRAYGWGLSGSLPIAQDPRVTFAVMAIAAVCTLFAGASLTGQWSSGAIMAALLPLMPCLVVTDTVPSAGYLFLTLLCVLLLVLTRNTRTFNARQACRLTAFLLIPVMLVTALLFHRNPRDGYESQADSVYDQLLEIVDKLPFLEVDENGEISVDFDDMPTLPSMPEITLGTGGGLDFTMPSLTIDPGIIQIFKDKVDLGALGPRDPLDTTVLTLKTTLRGTMYLREQSYDIYTGTVWEDSGENQWLTVEEQYLSNAEEVAISTRLALSSFLLPYYTGTHVNLLEGRVENGQKLTQYSYPVTPLLNNWKTLWTQNHVAAIDQIDSSIGNLDLPESTRKAAEEIIAQLGITEGSQVVSAADAIAFYVRNSATYDLNTQSMPEEYDDFAIWFLTESNTGYCVHFATATTVLLRAAGIPARYVEGYLATISGNTTSVKGSQAHAWVEYYVPDVGWVVLEPTPGSESSPPSPTDPTTPETTVPPVTTQPTVPETSVPETSVPETSVPETSVPETSVPETSVPETSVPETSVPETSVPETSMPGTSVPEASVPGTSVPNTTVPPTSSAPVTTEPDRTDDPHRDMTGLFTALSILLCALAIACALVGQWQLRLWFKRMRQLRGSANDQAVARWRECRRLAKLRRQKVPNVLRDLAWKARYSQYTITDAELQEFDGYIQRSITHVRKRPWYLRIVYRLIFAAY